jgi:hypothetical protein
LHPNSIAGKFVYKNASSCWEGYLKILLVVLDSHGMRHEDVVSRDIGFPVRVPAATSPKRCRTMVRRAQPQHVRELGEQVRLVERRPELDPVTKRLEAHVRVVIKLLP